MPDGHALVLTTASKAGTTGGTFGDVLAANSGDSLGINNFTQGGARIIRMWGIDSDSVAELALTNTRADSVHDPQYGVRFNIPALIPGGAAAVGSHDLIDAPSTIPVFAGDTLTLTVTTSASDDILVSYITEYDNLPGSWGQFASWERVQALRETTIGLRCAPVASGTAGLYGTARALNADDTRLSGAKYYAVLGWTLQTVATTITIKGPSTANNRVGLPGGALTLDTTMGFVELSKQTGQPRIPVLNGYDAANYFLECADGEASTSPKVDLFMYQLSGNPIG
jgi:hypothetical protein